MKKIIYISLILLFVSCKQNTEKEENKSHKPKPIEQFAANKNSIDSNSIQQSTVQKRKFILDKYDKKFDWSKTETNVSEIEKSRLVNKIKPHFDYFFESEFHKDNFEENLHFTDINNDNKIDIIFNGWSGGEPNIVRFFTQNDNGFDKWFEVLQDPLKIKITNNRVDEIIAIDTGCCDAYQVTISKYKVKDSLDLISQTTYIDWTDMKGIIIEPTKFEIINDIYFIRDSPKIDNETEHVRFESKGNIIGEFLKGQKGTAYKSITDSTGRVWWLMESEPLDSLQNSYFYNESKIKTSFIGWISSRYVKTIDN